MLRLSALLFAGCLLCLPARAAPGLLGGLSDAAVVTPLPMRLFSSPARAAAPAGDAAMRLRLQRAPLQMRVLRDDYQLAERAERRLNELPFLDIELRRSGGRLVPSSGALVVADHPGWNYLLGVGRVWSAPDQGMEASLPFALVEKNANCVHNGVLGFALDRAGQVLAAWAQIVSETCQYFKFDLWGPVALGVATGGSASEATGETAAAAGATTAAAQSWADLRRDYPGLDRQDFAGAGHIEPADISTAGFVFRGRHYSLGCPTRFGDYPYCDQLHLPSYSLAKTLFAGLGLMRLEKLYPGSRHARVADLVPACRDSGNWADVSLQHLLDMRSGNYGSVDFMVDEGSAETEAKFFVARSHQDKIGYACEAWPRRAAPGSQWVYHTTDTYVLGSAMSQLLRQYRGEGADSWRDLVLPLFGELKLSDASAEVLRASGPQRQPFTGFGLFLKPRDVVALAVAINSGALAAQLDPAMYRQAMGDPAGQPVQYRVPGGFRYRNGFWGFDATELLGCARPLVIPYMSGYGGINVVMMPNDSIYYLFSDGGDFAIADAIRASHRLAPMCDAAGDIT